MKPSERLSPVIGLMQDFTDQFETAYDLFEEAKFYTTMLTGEQYQKTVFEHAYVDPHEDRNVVCLYGAFFHGGYMGADLVVHPFNIEVLDDFDTWVEAERERVAGLKKKYDDYRARNHEIVKKAEENKILRANDNSKELLKAMRGKAKAIEGEMTPGDFINQFMEESIGIEREDAEMAMAVMFTKGELTLDKEMKLIVDIEDDGEYE